MCFCFFFFFQAEDGIRDKLVTGVQTCALPIFAIILAVLLLVHGVVTWPQRGLAQVSRLVLLPVVVVLLLAGLFNQGQFFLLVPVLINAVLLIAFGRTLLWGPPMVETFARLRGRELPDEEVVYCRVVTGLWCLFFAFNGGVTLWLALGATLAWWTLYTGVVSYTLIGTLFAAEMVYRYWRFRSAGRRRPPGSGEHTSELPSLAYFVCRLLLLKKKKNI